MSKPSQTLHGSCACGRNRYVVEIPAKESQLAELRYDNTAASRKLRIPPFHHLTPQLSTPYPNINITSSIHPSYPTTTLTHSPTRTPAQN